MTHTIPDPYRPTRFAENDRLYPARREPFLFSLLGQALAVVLVAGFTGYVAQNPGPLARPTSGVIPSLARIVFSGRSGGGGGSFDLLPAFHGALPPAALTPQLAPPTVMVPNENPRLPVEPTVMLTPDIKLIADARYGDPLAQILNAPSNGPGGPSGIGKGCCDGVGPGNGPGAGPGPGGTHLAGMGGVTLPRPLYSPDPMFSDEARRTKAAGTGRPIAGGGG